MPVTQIPPQRTPVLERIAQNMLATLATITKANGYSINATAFRPSPATDVPTKDGELCLIAGDAVLQEQRPFQESQWLQRFWILCLVVEGEGSSTTIDQRRTSVRADVEYALTHDDELGGPRPNARRGGLAEDSLVAEPVIPALEPNAHEGYLMVAIDVQYRTKYNDPYTSIYDTTTILSVTDAFDGGIAVALSIPVDAATWVASQFKLGGLPCSAPATPGIMNIIEVTPDPSISPPFAGRPWQALAGLLPEIVPASGTI